PTPAHAETPTPVSAQTPAPTQTSSVQQWWQTRFPNVPFPGRPALPNRDTTPPTASITTWQANFTIRFSEPVNALNTNNIRLTGTATATINCTTTTCTIRTNVTRSGNLTLTLANVTDTTGNSLNPATASITIPVRQPTFWRTWWQRFWNHLPAIPTVTPSPTVTVPVETTTPTPTPSTDPAPTPTPTPVVTPTPTPVVTPAPTQTPSTDPVPSTTPTPTPTETPDTDTVPPTTTNPPVTTGSEVGSYSYRQVPTTVNGMPRLINQFNPPTPNPTFDDAGVVKFTRDYLDAIDWNYSTGDTSFLDAYCEPDSEHCDTIREDAARFQSEEAEIYGARTYLASPNDAPVITAPTETTRVFTATVTRDPGLGFRPDGTTMPIEGYTRTMRFEMEWHGIRWAMASVTVVE
ncbi:MAG: hypothetical protein ACK5LN_08515, partial [Propioniciclava sp.]